MNNYRREILLKEFADWLNDQSDEIIEEVCDRIEITKAEKTELGIITSKELKLKYEH